MTSDASASPPGSDLASRIMRWLRWLMLCGSLLGFVVFFAPEHRQLLVDGLWIVALVLWCANVRQLDAGPLLTARPQRRDLLLLGLILVIFVAGWLPFYDNWRWAYTADSLVWYTFARSVARGAFSRNLLSVHGVDDHFTYLHSLASNALLFVFPPRLLWHRIGKLIVSCGSLAAIFAYFTLSLGRWWAAAVVVCTAVNYVWLWFSYVSYGHIDSFIFYFGTLALATLIWRAPQRLGQWMWCGLVGGTALFFTQTSWSAVAAVGVVLVGLALMTRRITAAAVYAVSFLLAATPVLLQLQDWLSMAVQQARSLYTWDYLRSIFSDLVWLPYAWDYCRIGIQGAFLRWPLGPLYVLGLALATVSLLPFLRRRLRVPPVARVLLALWLWDVVLLTATNNANPQPSTKRAYNLIPLQVFFGLLPLYTLWATVH